jgi:hypothetical protein
VFEAIAPALPLGGPPPVNQLIIICQVVCNVSTKLLTTGIFL